MRVPVIGDERTEDENWLPLRDRVILKSEVPKETPSGIHIPETARAMLANNKVAIYVEAVGPDVKSVRPGDWIALAPNVRAAGLNETTISVAESEIVAILDRREAQV